MNADHRVRLGEIEFHNLLPEPHGFGSGFALPRYPRAVRDVLESPGFLTANEATGGEIRFVTDALHLRIFLTADVQDMEVDVFRGAFWHSTHLLKQGGVSNIQVTPPDRFSIMRPAALLRGGFHPDVWRVILDRGSVVFHGLETFGQAVRQPTMGETPAIRWLAYGSSITHSSKNGYPAHAARLLGVDVQNKGLSGSCYIEREAADFLAADCEWDFATLELGINMRLQFTAEEFERRARYLVRRCVEAKPGRPVVLVSIYPNFANDLAAPAETAERQAAFDHILRQIADEHRGNNVHLIEGGSILTDLSWLGVDLLHPTDYGHARMGENLARALEPFVAKMKATKL